MANLDFAAFATQAENASANPRSVARATLGLVDGALRIRRAGDGIYGAIPVRPVTKPAEAIGAWISDISRNANYRRAEMREALIAAGAEVEAATREAAPSAGRLRAALYSDALGTLGSKEGSSNTLPWVIAGVLGGILLSILYTNRKKR